MQIKLLAFAQAADALGFRERFVEGRPGESARTLLLRIAPHADCGAMRVAADCEYVTWDEPIPSCAELALIPPVSGG